MISLSSTPLAWMNRDARLILAARGLRAFGRAPVIVMVAIYLHLLGFSSVQIGLFLSMGLAGSAIYSFVVIFVGDTVGRRRLLVFFSLMTAGSALGLASTDNIALLVVATFVGGVGLAGGASAGAFPPLEQVSLADTVPAHRRTELYAIYTMMEMVGSVLGALAAGLPSIYQSVFGLSELSAYKIVFVLFAVFVGLSGLCYSFLSPSVEVASAGNRWSNPLRLPSRRLIFTLSGLFTVDDFATGLVVQSLVSLWFFTHFGLELESLAFISSGFYVLSAISLWVAAKLANRFGMLNVMVFTSLPANLLIIAVPFLPTAWLAATAWLVRGFFSLMDIPAKNAYTMAVVGPNERSAMAGLNSVGRSVAGAVSPSATTALWNIGLVSIPFVSSGAIKLAYDAALYFTFRNVKPPEEIRRGKAEPETKASVSPSGST